MLSAVFERSRQRGATRLVLLAIANYADDTGMAFPSVESIAKKAMLSESCVQVAIRKAAGAGELTVSVGVARAGANRYQLTLPEAIEGGAESAPVQTSAPEPSLPRLRALEGTDGQGAESAPPQKLHPRELLDRAEVLWVTERKRAKLTHWIDLGGLKRLRAQVALALREGATWADVETSLRAHAPDPKASAWQADAWILETQLARQDREHRVRAQHERRENDRLRDERIDAERRELEARHPGKPWSEIVRIELAARQRSG